MKVQDPIWRFCLAFSISLVGVIMLLNFFQNNFAISFIISLVIGVLFAREGTYG